MKLLIILLALPLYGLCLPLYKKLNPDGFPIYLAWTVFCGIVWLLFVLFVL